MFLTVNDHLQHVMIAGPEDGPVLVLLHSLGTSGLLWQAQVAHFARSHRVICPDFRGHGLSAESRVPLTCADLAGDVLAILDRFGVNSFALAGCSLGGVVAQIVAARAGQRVTGLVIFDSYIASLNPPMWRDRAAKVRADGLASIAEGVLKLWISPAEAETPEGAGLRQILARASSEGYAAACDALAEVDNRAIAGSILCPTIVASGSEDRAVPLAASQALAEAISGASVEVIAGAGHIPLLHHAETCCSLIGRIT
ncbi:alpha/beta fold hydrolase [Xinfangfangia pollutisoli]|uniref:alpha/beta fold hydrolase n=1 Tax=Xinfangfangia pollutisoli TaxID=2865960 RepID=UPI001CD3E548|nr:alpha/beta fold hydrolase [Xinfangfangia pollutisoli]